MNDETVVIIEVQDGCVIGTCSNKPDKVRVVLIDYDVEDEEENKAVSEECVTEYVTGYDEDVDEALEKVGIKI